MSRVVRALGAILAASVVALPVAASADFPPRPAGAPLHETRGVLQDWGIGNRSGGISIRTQTGVRWFAVSDRIYVDGKRVICALPPRRGQKPDKAECESWPAGLVLGTSRVVVSYWDNPASKDSSDREIVSSLSTVR